MKYFVQILVAVFLFIAGSAVGQSQQPHDRPVVNPDGKKLKEIIEFYPNPSKGSFKLNIKEEGIEEFNLAIYDLNGALVFEKVFKGIFAGISFDLKLKKPGLYLIKLNTSKEQWVEKILISP